MSLSERWRRPADEAGLTALEVTITSLLLVLVMAVFLAGLAGFQESETFTRRRNEALDDLRLTANVFAKDARHATAIISNEPDKVVMMTYSGPSATTTPVQVTYEVIDPGDGTLNLRRVRGTAVRVFNIKLTSSSVFCFNATAGVCPTVVPGDVRSIEISVSTQLDRRHSPVALSTEVNLRNVH